MRALEAEQVLLLQLKDRGVDLERRGHFHVGEASEVRHAIDIFFAFAEQAIDEADEVAGQLVTVDRYDDGDLLIFETGTAEILPPRERPYWTLSDEPIAQTFELSLRRQFSFHSDQGGYVGMNEVSLNVQIAGAPSTLRNEQIWGTAGPEWTREQAAKHGRANTLTTGASAWKRAVTSTPAFTHIATTEPMLFYFLQSDI